MNYKKYLNAVKVSGLLEKQCSTSGAAFFLSIGSSMTAIKMETSAMNMWSEIMIGIKLKLLLKGFMGMLQVRNSLAGWIKYKPGNDNS